MLGVVGDGAFAGDQHVVTDLNRLCDRELASVGDEAPVADAKLGVREDAAGHDRDGSGDVDIVAEVDLRIARDARNSFHAQTLPNRRAQHAHYRIAKEGDAELLACLISQVAEVENDSIDGIEEAGDGQLESQNSLAEPLEAGVERSFSSFDLQDEVVDKHSAGEIRPLRVAVLLAR